MTPILNETGRVGTARNNILAFIDTTDLNCLDELPVCFEYINLHTRNKTRAVNTCRNFFLNYTDEDAYFTDSSDYQYHGGWRYKLSKGRNGTYWLTCDSERIEV